MNTLFLDRTANGLPIPAYRFGSNGPEVLILGGVHGDEREGVEAAHGLLGRWRNGFPFRLRVTLIPALNLDGVLRASRLNARGVDLNRNMATKDWSPIANTPRYQPGPRANSEPETEALVRLLDEVKPRFILSLHSWKPMLNVNGDCRPEAEAIARRTGYVIEETIGYPTPGCLGTYAGIERGLPTLTYEIERGLPAPEILAVHVPAIEEGLKVTEHVRT